MLLSGKLILYKPLVIHILESMFANSKYRSTPQKYREFPCNTKYEANEKG